MKKLLLAFFLFSAATPQAWAQNDSILKYDIDQKNYPPKPESREFIYRDVQTFLDSIGIYDYIIFNTDTVHSDTLASLLRKYLGNELARFSGDFDDLINKPTIKDIEAAASLASDFYTPLRLESLQGLSIGNIDYSGVENNMNGLNSTHLGYRAGQGAGYANQYNAGIQGALFLGTDAGLNLNFSSQQSAHVLGFKAGEGASSFLTQATYGGQNFGGVFLNGPSAGNSSILRSVYASGVSAGSNAYGNQPNLEQMYISGNYAGQGMRYGRNSVVWGIKAGEISWMDNTIAGGNDVMAEGDMYSVGNIILSNAWDVNDNVGHNGDTAYYNILFGHKIDGIHDSIIAIGHSLHLQNTPTKSIVFPAGWPILGATIDYSQILNAPAASGGVGNADSLVGIPGALYALDTDIPTNNTELTNGAGYITGYTVTQNDVTQHQAALSITESQISDLSHFSGAYSDLTNAPPMMEVPAAPEWWQIETESFHVDNPNSGAHFRLINWQDQTFTIDQADDKVDMSWDGGTTFIPLTFNYDQTTTARGTWNFPGEVTGIDISEIDPVANVSTGAVTITSADIGTTYLPGSATTFTIGASTGWSVGDRVEIVDLGGDQTVAFINAMQWEDEAQVTGSTNLTITDALTLIYIGSDTWRIIGG